MVFAMSKSNLIAFRIPSELQDEFNRSVLASGGDKTSWLVDAIRMKLGQPEKSIDSRMLGLVERMEKAAASLIAGKPNIPLKRRTKNAKTFHDKCEKFNFRASNETAALTAVFLFIKWDHFG